jgi:starch phosphorylase
MRQDLAQSFADHILYTQGRSMAGATAHDRYFALAHAVRDQLMELWQKTSERYEQSDAKRVYYLSAEFLLGRALSNNLINLGIYDKAKAAVEKHGSSLADLLEQEPDAGLGNGGLGRLAACYLESGATLGIPLWGYGIRYEFGIFSQEIRNGQQVEHPEEWLRAGNPWEVVRPEYTVPVRFGGRVIDEVDANGGYRPCWVDATTVLGVAYDTPIAGYDMRAVNTLRLWQARASNEFDLQVFNDGDYFKAVEDKNQSEVISKVLYPNDAHQAGQALRLKQQYFFVACSVADILRRYKRSHSDLSQLASKVSIQLNDTHPAVTVAELMRVLIDEERMSWDQAWPICVAVTSYTNHTLLAEALERWPLHLFATLLPRHLQIILEINRRFLREVQQRYPTDEAKLARLSIIEEGHERRVRMAHLAVVGSHTVNGVAALHSRLLREQLMPEMSELYPGKFVNKTNGITPRRWLVACNPRLTELIREALGGDFAANLDKLAGLAKYANDAAFLERFAKIKHQNKQNLTQYLGQTMGITLDPSALFDVQIKRLHEYKRQLLNVLSTIRRYLDIKNNVVRDAQPRVVMFGAKAAPGYRQAKLIIKLIHSVAGVVNADRAVGDKLKVVFVPNYRVSLAERLIPAANLSQQISTAGLEASGTGNMKLSLNGALTIGTLDGANVEIRDAVGPENFFLFGLTTEQVKQTRIAGYDPRSVYEGNSRLREVIDLISRGFFEPSQTDLFAPIVYELLTTDHYLLLADFAAYDEAQRRVDDCYRKSDWWQRAAVLNVAGMGYFSSDRAVAEYAKDIWRL